MLSEEVHEADESGKRDFFAVSASSSRYPLQKLIVNGMLSSHSSGTRNMFLGLFCAFLSAR